VRLSSPHLAQALSVADAILYEGYLLYPYRQSSRKNQARFQFGVLMPPAYAAVDPFEPSASQTECLAEARDDARLEVLVRFLHVQQRTVRGAPPVSGGEWADVAALTVDGTEYTRFTEATEREVGVELAVGELGGAGVAVPFAIEAGETSEDLAGPDGAVAGRLVHQWDALSGVLRVQAERVAGPFQALKLHLRIENVTSPGGPLVDRDDGLRYALVATHALIGLPGGSFISMTDPPEWAAAEVAACHNESTWPVLAGPEECRDLILSSPVILYDHPQIAPESAGDLFDATEIDEILTLRTLALTDEEKREARATDPRAADLIDRLDGLPPEMMEKLHGAIRYLEPGAGPVSSSAAGGVGPTGAVGPAGSAAGPVGPGAGRVGSAAGAVGPGAGPVGPFPAARAADEVPVFSTPDVPWWDPGSDSSVSPETDEVLIDGVPVGRGSKVLMRPGARRADAQDLFLAGREALVEAVLQDVDGQVHVAVTPVDDPMAELQQAQGRFLYFAPDELAPIGKAPGQEKQS
jgi:hypothetical protein